MPLHKLLLVDDSPSALLALRSQLGQDLFTVVTASSAREALTLLESTLPDCILTDFEMPDMNGPELCKAIKATETLKNIPVIVLTSREDSQSILASIEAGADDYIAKTLDSRVIVAKIAAMLRLKKMSDELNKLQRVVGIKQIIATYNHEFNNPLTIAIGNLSRLESLATDDAQRKHIQSIQGALDRMSDLVRKIRSLRDYVEANYADVETMVALKKDA